jgi:hypothetical protein
MYWCRDLQNGIPICDSIAQVLDRRARMHICKRLCERMMGLLPAWQQPGKLLPTAVPTVVGGLDYQH